MLHKWRWKCNFKIFVIPLSALRSNALRSCSTKREEMQCVFVSIPLPRLEIASYDPWMSFNLIIKDKVLMTENFQVKCLKLSENFEPKTQPPGFCTRCNQKSCMSRPTCDSKNCKKVFFKKIDHSKINQLGHQYIISSIHDVVHF